jgi:hypothetical protein
LGVPENTAEYRKLTARLSRSAGSSEHEAEPVASVVAEHRWRVGVEKAICLPGRGRPSALSVACTSIGRTPIDLAVR